MPFSHNLLKAMRACNLFRNGGPFAPYPAKVISNSNLLKKVSYVFIIKPLSFVARKIMEQKK